MGSKTLLLISESFPPLNNIAAQRFPAMLPVLETGGWQVFVLTKQSDGPLPVRLPESQILRIGRHPQEGLRIRTGSPFARGPRALRALSTAYHARGLTLRAVDNSLLAWRRAVRRALPDICRRLPAVDVVLGSYGPAAGLWLARDLAKPYQAPWVADFRDPAALRADGRPLPTQWLDRQIERHLVRSAAALTTCGRSWASDLAALHGRPVHVVYNGWDLSHLQSQGGLIPPRVPDAVGGQRYLYYAGRFYERQMEAVRRLLMAVAGTPFIVVIRSLGPPEREARIREMSDQLHVADQLRLLSPVPLPLAHAEAQGAATNLVLETVDDSEPWARGQLGGKFLQLLPLAPPILFIGRADSEAGEILRQAGKGALCTEVGDIRGRLQQLASAGSLAGPAVAAEVAEFAKVRQGEKLLALLDAVCGRAQALRGPAA